MTTHTSGAADLPEALREVQIIQSWCEARCLPSPSAGDCVSLAAALTAGQAPAGVLGDAERYRWLRNPTTDVALVLDKRTAWVPPDDVVHGVGGHWSYEYRAGDELDAAIDAAMTDAALAAQQGDKT